MNWTKRFTLVIAIVAALLALGGIAAATVTFTENAQSEFKVDAEGNPVGEGDTLMSDAWRLFMGSLEGQRIFRWAMESPAEITIDVLPEDQVGGGDAYGTARVVARGDDGRPSEMLLKIRNENVISSSTVADTIWHEFRHAEIFYFGNDEHDHDALDGDADRLNDIFKADVARQIRIRSTTTTTVDPNPPTPHYDRITKRSRHDEEMRRAAIIFGDALNDIRDSIQFNDATFTEGYIDLELYGTYKLGYTIQGVTEVYNESALECGDRQPDLIVVCSVDGVLDMAPGEVLVGVMITREEIPIQGDVSLIYSLVADSDRDPADDWVAVPPFDWDLFQHTDRWYQLIYDHSTDAWFVTVTQLNADGSNPGRGMESSVRAVVAGDTVAFFVSMTEFRHAQPGVRLTAFGHDGFFSESFRGSDLNQVDPTLPPEPVGAEVYATVDP